VCVQYLASDQNGNLYGVTATGELLHNRHQDADPRKPLIYAGAGRPIARGFHDIRHLISWPAPSGSHLGMITRDGTFLYNRVDNPASAAPQLWRSAIGSVVATGWGNARHVFCDQTGAVYSVLPTGELGKNQLTVSNDGATLEQRGLGSRLGTGWTDVLHVFSGGPGRFLSVDLWGALRYNAERRDERGEVPLAYPGPGKEVAQCWNRLVAVFGAGNGGIYGITIEGVLLYSRLTVDGGRPSLMQRGDGQPVGKVCKACRLSTTVEGYCWPLSVAPGDTVDFKVSVNPKSASDTGSVNYSTRYVRLRRVIQAQSGDRHIDVADDRQMSVGGDYTAELQDIPKEPWKNGCNWKISFQLVIPRDPVWPSGLYAAECRPEGADPSEQGASYIVFILKPPAGERGELAVLSNINTWNAYNCWGGSSKYCCHEGSPLPQQLSFERPHPGTCPSQLPAIDCPEVVPQTCHLTRAELWVLTWLEDNGYPFHLYSDHDLDHGIEGISTGTWRYKALILNTHAEYWTFSMYDKVKSYVEDGGSLIYLGGNGIYEHVDYADGAGRVMRVLQEATGDLSLCNEQNTLRVPCLFRSLTHPKRPERAILGVQFENVVGLTATPYEVTAPKHPFLDGVAKDRIGTRGLFCAASGWEVDHLPKRLRSDTTLLAHGREEGNPAGADGADMVCRTIRPKNNFVFSAGSLQFGASLVVDENLQRLIKNVLEAALHPRSTRSPRRRRLGK
jgi:N,N-dimethylformamidase beta subunit-like protein/tachylectin